MKILVLCIIMLLIGGIVGYGAGFAYGVKFTVTKGYEFLQNSGVDFSLTAKQVSDLVYSYKKRILETTRGASATIAENIIKGE